MKDQRSSKALSERPEDAGESKDEEDEEDTSGQ
jgi:hypothetical protein